jgi:hypothetical protein
MWQRRPACATRTTWRKAAATAQPRRRRRYQQPRAPARPPHKALARPQLQRLETEGLCWCGRAQRSGAGATPVLELHAGAARLAPAATRWGWPPTQAAQTAPPRRSTAVWKQRKTRRRTAAARRARRQHRQAGRALLRQLGYQSRLCWGRETRERKTTTRPATRTWSNALSSLTAARSSQQGEQVQAGVASCGIRQRRAVPNSSPAAPPPTPEKMRGCTPQPMCCFLPHAHAPRDPCINTLPGPQV